MKKYFISAFLVLISISSWAQVGTVKGRVIDSEGQPIGFANIILKNTTHGTSSDGQGYFSLYNLPEGSQALHVTAIGYESIEQGAVISANKETSLEITLVESITQLQTVEILGRTEKSYANTTSFLATKTSTRLEDIPQSIGYVTKELALDQAAFRVNDVVKNISGVNQFSFYNDISIRGFRVRGQQNSGNLVNGMRAFTSFWKQQLIPHIERVEVIKGPASALFGNASPGGTINRVTKKPLKEQRQSISATVGSFNTFRTLGDFTGPMSKDKTLLYRLNLGYENSGSFRDLQFDKNLIIAPSFSFLPNERTRLNFDIVYQGSEGRLDRGHAVFGDGDLFSVPVTRALNASNDFLKEESINATISLRHQFSENISLNSIYMRSSYVEDLLEHRTANAFATLGDGSMDPEQVEMRVFIRKRDWNNDNFNNYFNFDFETGVLSHKLLVGYDYFQQLLEPGGSQLQARGYLTADRSSMINSFNPDNATAYALDSDGNPVPNVPHFDLTDPTANRLRDMSDYIYQTNLFPQSRLRTHGIYLQNQITLGDLQLLLGLRQEYFYDELNYKTENEEFVTQSALIPRLGMVYSLSSRVNVYATYTEGYQPQTASIINDPNAGGPFDPLTSNLIEIGTKTNWFDGRLNATLAFYRLVQQGELYSANDPSNPDLQVQIGEEEAKGIELDIIGRITENWSVIASYSYNDAVITESDDESEVGRQKPNAPEHTGNIWTKYVIDQGMFKGIGIGLGANFVTERFGSIVRTDNPPLFPGYELVDAAIYYQVDKFQIQVNVNNIFDKTHWVGGYDFIRAFPGAPRNVMTTVSYTF
ncbi:TonB-dependent receptor [Fulvivirga sp. M361]|uniref:TonB-dependent receptor n=1 Tax=Fulvivirga sp. M361 TaxID=2594266 RepID=UPI00117A8FD6|nr:TonB-dependent receptor [Fulvivirga sp. M361]TRX58410.1 TonB-dependent receptor [Fulvivirga sp. M361]